MKHCNAAQFASAVGISLRVARKALSRAAQGKTWRGHTLPVVELEAQRGGDGGKVWGLRLDAAPTAIRDLFNIDTTAVEQPFERPFKCPFNTAAYDTQTERMALLQPILDTAPRSEAREAAYVAAVAKSGKPKKTLMNWIAAVNKSGPAALLPSQRADKGQKRVFVTRKWDAGIGLSDAAKQAVADDLGRKARSMIANDGTSIRETIRQSEFELQKLSRKVETSVPLGKLAALCKLNAKWAKPLEQYRLVHIHDKDHKRWQDQNVSRIRRHLHASPMALLMGDVHYMDILVEQGAEPVRVRLIGWMDMSSLFTWITPVFLSKGKGIRQEDVAQSLAQVTMCPHGGIPEEYYLDNGSEYAELPRLTSRLTVLAERDFKTTLAKPYSAQSKGDIENHFHILQGIYQSLDGYIGGDRTNKKSVSKGKVVKPYRHGLAQLEADIHAMTAIYNDRPQSGRLNGISPLQALEAKIRETSFVARVPDEDSFDLIFSKQDTRMVRQGCINRDGEQYKADFLDDILNRDKVEILIPLRSRRDRVFVRRRGIDLGWANALPKFDQGDRDGARLQSAMESRAVAKINALRVDVDPEISTFDIQKSNVRKVAPDTPAPENWTYAIDKTGDDTAAVELDKKRAATNRAYEDQRWASIIAKRTAEKRKASGGDH